MCATLYTGRYGGWALLTAAGVGGGGDMLEVVNDVRCVLRVPGVMLCMLFCMLLGMLLGTLLSILEAVEGELRSLEC